MNKFEVLTKYIPMIENNTLGKWIFDKENDEIIKKINDAPFVSYSEMVFNFIDDINTFAKEVESIDFTNYITILKSNGIDCKTDSLQNIDVSGLNEQCVTALIFSVIRAERFCEGRLLNFFKNGCIVKWLEKLKSYSD